MLVNSPTLCNPDHDLSQGLSLRCFILSSELQGAVSFVDVTLEDNISCSDVFKIYPLGYLI